MEEYNFLTALSLLTTRVIDCSLPEGTFAAQDTPICITELKQSSLTLPLPLSSAAYSTDLAECLDEYTKLEEITQVECAKCTLLHAQQKLEKMLPTAPSFESVDMEVSKSVMRLPPELRAAAFLRLRNIQIALESDDFTDKTLTETCTISKKARISSTSYSICGVHSPECASLSILLCVALANWARVHRSRAKVLT